MTETTTVLPPPAGGNAAPLANPSAHRLGQNARESEGAGAGVQDLGRGARRGEDMRAQNPGVARNIPSPPARRGEDMSAQNPDQGNRESESADAHFDQGAWGIEGIPDEEMLYDLADLFKVFSDTTRIKILYVLMERDQCVADIAEAIGATQSAVSHQLRILKQARLVRFQRHGKSIRYSLADDHVYTVLAQGMSHICE